MGDIFMPRTGTVDEWRGWYKDLSVFAREQKAQLTTKDAEIERLREPMQEFCDRRDRGEIISTYTYSKFKAVLDV